MATSLIWSVGCGEPRHPGCLRRGTAVPDVFVLGRGEAQLGGGSDVAMPLEEVAADGVEPVVTLEPRGYPIDHSRPAAGP